MNGELKEKYDVAVIGSGISGLTSALLCAKKGKTVAVFEQSGIIAPLLSGFSRNGVHFDTGFHYSGVLGQDEVGGYMFRQLGLDIAVEPCDSDGYDEMHLLSSGRTFKMPSGRARLEQKLTEFFPQEKEGIKKYLDLTQNIINGVPFLNFHKKSFADEELFRFFDDKKTLSDVLNEHFKSEELKSLFSFSSVLYGTPPSEIAFLLHCCCSGIMFDSAWKIKGGMKVFVEALKKALRDAGVEIFTNKKAQSITVENADLKTVGFADGSKAQCRICISSIHPKEFIKIAPQESYRDKNSQRIMNMRETEGFFALYGILKEPLQSEAINNAAFVNFDDFKKDHKDFMYINFSGSRPQAVCAVLSVDSDEKSWNLCEKDYQEKKKRVGEKIKAALRLNWPELAEKIIYADSATPRTFKKYVNYYGSYGIMHSVGQANILPLTKIPGLFVVGQAVVAPGLVGAMVSSFLLDKMMQRHEKGGQAVA
ncbi:MAG: NAD(P)/FAD-dependent oxidoreductase [Endomicrobium sp.]|nr:NAD(P)/FAD-dependent oxidoreductase [Endomicrobium sp.]